MMATTAAMMPSTAIARTANICFALSCDTPCEGGSRTSACKSLYTRWHNDVKRFTLRVVDELTRLAALREKRSKHQEEADRIRDEIHAIIRTMPIDSDKRAIERAAGISRPTIYRLLKSEDTK
jgi:hypothetical protein